MKYQRRFPTGKQTHWRIVMGMYIIYSVWFGAQFMYISVANAAARPNIVVIMTDDLDSGSTRTALSEGLMPNLQRFIVNNGTVFTESFVTFPLCCPSRATYLSGLYPHNHKVLWNKPPAGGFANFDDSSTVATWLQNGGYRTGHIGKYLNGYNDASYVPPGWDEWHSLVGNSTYCMYNYTISNDGIPMDYGDTESDYQTDVLAGYVDRFIKYADQNNDDQPMFLSITPLAPHLETSCNRRGIRAAPRHEGSVNLDLPMPPSFNEADMSDKPTWMQSLPLLDKAELTRIYNERIAALRAVDDLIGQLMVSLIKAGELNNTVLVFTSDNGYLFGEHRWESKVVLYEESIRVPLIMRMPQSNTPAIVNGIALNNDLAPTIADLASVTPWHDVDGRSLLPLLQSTGTPWRKRFMIEHPPADTSFPVPPYLAVRETDSSSTVSLVYAETFGDSSNSLITDKELYDLGIDPFQLESLHGDFSLPRILQRLKLHKYIEEFKTCANGTCQAIEDYSGN